MIFSSGFLTFLVYAALALGATAALGLLIMLVKELKKGTVW